MMVTATMTESWWLSRGGGGSTGGVMADRWWYCDDIAGGVAKVVMVAWRGVVARWEERCSGGGGWLMPTAAVGRNIFRWRRNSRELV
nr:hypothetical protein [Tanacetum cinerariifolium]